MAASSASSPSLVGLPPELVNRIVQQTDLSTHYDLGVTCTYL